MDRGRVRLRVLDGAWDVLRLEPDAPVPSWFPAQGLVSLTRTPGELSLVCPAGTAPDGVQSQPDWCAFELEGPLDFSLTGVLASLAGPLAAAGISIFAFSTYDTDYVLVPCRALEAAVAALRAAGHAVVAESARAR
jgi:uncharacterized protein